MTTYTLQSKYGGQTNQPFNSNYTFNEINFIFDGYFSTGYSNQSKNASTYSNGTKSTATTYNNQIKN